MHQGFDCKLSKAWARKIPMLITPNNAVIVSIITTVLYGPRGDKTAWPAEQSKEIKELQPLRPITEDLRQHRMSEKRRAAGGTGFRAARSRRKSGVFRRPEPIIIPAAGSADSQFETNA